MSSTAFGSTRDHLIFHVVSITDTRLSYATSRCLGFVRSVENDLVRVVRVHYKLDLRRRVNPQERFGVRFRLKKK